MVALTANLLRRGDTNGRVTNIELVFDLVYVFAVTQLSHHRRSPARCRRCCCWRWSGWGGSIPPG